MPTIRFYTHSAQLLVTHRLKESKTYMAGQGLSHDAAALPHCSQNFAHVVFPHQKPRRRVMNLAHGSISRRLIRRPPLRLPDEEAQFFAWLFQRAQLDSTAYREETLLRRRPAALRAIRATSLHHARELIALNPALVHVAIGALLVGVTSFFRDPLVFEQLQHQHLPEVAANRRGIYVWSVGCSEGAELRSLAVLLDELGLLPHSYLLGTDCRPEAIAACRAAEYNPSMLHQVTPERLQRYFAPAGQNYRFHVDRATIRWRTANLLAGLEPGYWDVIAFRNTAMYLKPEVTDGLWERIEAALRPGGLLVLGKAERPVGTRKLASLGNGIYQRLRR